jgi:hypothetical protein
MIGAGKTRQEGKQKYGGDKKYIYSFGWKDKERDHLEDLSIDGE